MRALYRKDMEKLVEKEPDTFYDRIEIASATLHLINELQSDIRKLPWSARLEVERRKYELYQETLKNQPPATWAPANWASVAPTWSPASNDEGLLSRDKVGALIRDDGYR
ncbi:hypothetical protein VKT23_013675 [Stygiomarasmius scandens]|uniref:Uncharacterized protein n=1 Tax=Marasmiellus scandens TaxID=2682957 RepID=A0ABR1J2R5_9AGAR